VRRVETRRQDRLAVTKAENTYDYAGQDPINSYDLDWTMLAADVEPGSHSQITITVPTNGGTDTITFVAAQTSLTSDVLIEKHSFSSSAWANGGDARAGRKGKPQAQWVRVKNEGRPTDFNHSNSTNWWGVYGGIIQCISGGITASAAAPPFPHVKIGAFALGCIVGAATQPGSTGPTGHP
jgi:hypothetical protein